MKRRSLVYFRQQTVPRSTLLRFQATVSQRAHSPSPLCLGDACPTSGVCRPYRSFCSSATALYTAHPCPLPQQPPQKTVNNSSPMPTLMCIRRRVVIGSRTNQSARWINSTVVRSGCGGGGAITTLISDGKKMMPSTDAAAEDQEVSIRPENSTREGSVSSRGTDARQEEQPRTCPGQRNDRLEHYGRVWHQLYKILGEG